MSDSREPPGPRYEQGQQVMLLFLRRSWPAMITQYRGWHTDSKGTSDHYYKVLFRRKEDRDSMRLDVPERYLLPMEQQEGVHHA